MCRHLETFWDFKAIIVCVLQNGYVCRISHFESVIATEKDIWTHPSRSLRAGHRMRFLWICETPDSLCLPLIFFNNHKRLNPTSPPTATNTYALIFNKVSFKHSIRVDWIYCWDLRIEKSSNQQDEADSRNDGRFNEWKMIQLKQR